MPPVAYLPFISGTLGNTGVYRHTKEPFFNFKLDHKSTEKLLWVFVVVAVLFQPYQYCLWCFLACSPYNSQVELKAQENSNEKWQKYSRGCSVPASSQAVQEWVWIHLSSCPSAPGGEFVCATVFTYIKTYRYQPAFFHLQAAVPWLQGFYWC